MSQITQSRRISAAAFFACALAAGAATDRCCGADTDHPPPNVVLLFLDDCGYGDLSCYGHPTIRTPNLDRMAGEGIRFTQFYSASPACSASRYSLLTGRWPIHSGFGWVLMPESPKGIRANELTLAEGLRGAGYTTACFGKWHLGDSQVHLPLQHGFQKYFGLPYSNDMQPPRHPPLPLFEGNNVITHNPDQQRLTRAYTDRTLEFIEQHSDERFFCYVPFSMPHIPLHPGESFRGVSLRGEYGDTIEEIDSCVGLILDKLRTLAISERTLVLFASDNGPWIIKGSRAGSAGLLRDGKGSTWEGGVRVPCIAWWPGVTPAGKVSHQVSSTVDLLPTLFNLTGVSTELAACSDGVDLSRVVLGEKESIDRPPLFFYGANNHLFAVRDGPWKLHIRQHSQTGRAYFSGRVPLLFNVEQDPSEQYDLSTSNSAIVGRLQELIADHKESLAAHSAHADQCRQQRVTK